ncbi:MAG: hypothetical protein K1060chlam5_00469 [Candidatus Anoxychlamydiales bacterium]|nr:hypothetical protein [Candidatus Anoxychlamydiales bacterium]
MLAFKLLSIWITFGLSCSIIAKNKGKKPFFWFYMGVFFGIIALFTILFLKKEKKEIKKEIINSPLKDQNQTIDPTIKDTNFWYYLDGDNKSCGPMSLKVLKDSILDKKINPSTYVWNDTLDGWKKIDELNIFKTTN